MVSPSRSQLIEFRVIALNISRCDIDLGVRVKRYVQTQTVQDRFRDLGELPLPLAPLPALQRGGDPAPRGHAVAIPVDAPAQGLPGPRLGQRERTGRAPAGQAPRRRRTGISL